MTQPRRWIVLAALALAAGLFVWLDLGRYLSLEFIKSQQAQLASWRAGHPVAAAAVFFLVYVTAVNALFDPLKKFRADYSVIPWAIFVDPEVARVGLNEQQARERNIAHEVYRLRP